MKNTLIAMGFWRSDFEPDLPDPNWFIDENWGSEERLFIIQYLKKCYKIADYMGFSYCRFLCKEPNDKMGASDLSDGQYVFPEGLIHYIENHQLRLPLEFINHALQDKIELNTSITTTYEYDFTWWKAQNGFESNQHKTIELSKQGILFIDLQRTDYTQELEKWLKNLLQKQKVYGIYHFLLKLQNEKKAEIKGVFSLLSQINKNLTEKGLKVEFKELPIINLNSHP